MFAAPSLTRNATAAATSSGVLGRCDGARSTMRWIRSAWAAITGVIVGPGATVFTRTPNGPYSAAQPRTRATARLHWIGDGERHSVRELASRDLRSIRTNQTRTSDLQAGPEPPELEPERGFTEGARECKTR